MDQILNNKYLLVKILRHFKAQDLQTLECVSYKIADVIESERLFDFVCGACLYNEPSQVPHMWGPYGCLAIPEDDEESSEEEELHKCKRRCCHG